MPYNQTIPKVKEHEDRGRTKYDIKRDLIEFKKFSKEDVTRSDLQGNAMTYGMKYVGAKKIRLVSEIENIFLLYADDELDINSAKRYILDIQNKSKEN